MKLNGKVAIVTGAGGGIGGAIALAFAREGAKVVVNDVSAQSANAVAEKIKSEGSEALAVVIDARRADQVQEMVRKTIETFGRIDVLVNNVGQFSRGSSPVIDLPEAEWDYVIELNLKTTFLVSQAVARHMVEQKSGKIINMSSCGAKGSLVRLSAYCAAKAGVNSFTQTVAKELAPYNINVNAIAPGYVPTREQQAVWKRHAESNENIKQAGFEAFVSQAAKQLAPLQRPQPPEAIASMAVFLASKDADEITGQVIAVDGGMIMY